MRGHGGRRIGAGRPIRRILLSPDTARRIKFLLESSGQAYTQETSAAYVALLVSKIEGGNMLNDEAFKIVRRAVLVELARQREQIAGYGYSEAILAEAWSYASSDARLKEWPSAERSFKTMFEIQARELANG